MLGEVTRVEWPETAPVIAIDQESATSMLRNKYANNITDEQMDEYNAAVDTYLAANGFDPANIPTPTPTPAPEPVVEPAPAVPEAPAAPAVPDAPAVQDPPPAPPAPAEEAEVGKKKGK